MLLEEDIAEKSVFENRVKVDDNKINVETLQELIKDNELAGYTFTGITSGILITKRLSEKS